MSKVYLEVQYDTVVPIRECHAYPNDASPYEPPESAYLEVQRAYTPPR